MTDAQFLPALLAALPSPPRQARTRSAYDQLIDAARLLADLHAAGNAAGLSAGLGVVEQCFTEGTKPAALAAAALLRLLLEFADDQPGGSEAIAAHSPPVTREVCQRVWIQQGELSEWLNSNAPLAGEDRDA